jgi:dynein heavy chain, axonemal
VDLLLLYHEIMILTAESMLALTKPLITNGKCVLSPGPTGTGKSKNCYRLLTNSLGENYQYIALTFSAQTSANQTQDSIYGYFPYKAESSISYLFNKSYLWIRGADWRQIK